MTPGGEVTQCCGCSEDSLPQAEGDGDGHKGSDF